MNPEEITISTIDEFLVKLKKKNLNGPVLARSLQDNGFSKEEIKTALSSDGFEVYILFGRLMVSIGRSNKPFNFSHGSLYVV